MDKAAMRRVCRTAVLSMDANGRVKAEDSINACLAAMAVFQTAAVILAYLPLPDEVDLRPSMQRWMNEGRQVCVPCVDWETSIMGCSSLASLAEQALQPDRHGLRVPRDPQPVSCEAIDVVIVPGVAFDAAGGRLGRGGGFYDRFLAEVAAVAIGVALPGHLVDEVPREDHDRLVSAVATADGLLTGRG